MRTPDPFNIPKAITHLEGFSWRRQDGSNLWFGDLGEKISLFITNRKVKAVFIIIFLFWLVLFARLFWLQIFQGQNYAAIAEGNRLRLNILPAERGIIYDRFGTPLVANIPHFSLFFIPGDLPKNLQDQAAIANQLSRLKIKDETQILSAFAGASPASFTPVLLADDLTRDQVIALSVYEAELSGIKLITEPRREYLSGSGLSHVLGYLGEINEKELSSLTDKNYQAGDSLGKNGLELYYEDILRGLKGEEEVEVDARGKVKKIIARREPTAGQDIILSIDLDLQKELAASLSRAIATAGGSGSGVAVALDPKSGEVLALVSLPDFDNNFFSAGINREAYNKYLSDPQKPLFNRAIAGTYPPGSTFKPVVASAALQAGIIDESTAFFSTGGLRIDKWFFPDWKAGGHGRTNVISALANSVNTFFYYIGGGYGDFEGLGVDLIKKYSALFNLGQTTGIDLPGEASGFLPDKDWKLATKGEPWYIGDTYHLSIGQGDILVTPLQVALYTAAVANGGTLYRPHLLKTSTETASSYLLKTDFITPQNIELVRRGLRATILSGSARSLGSLPVSAAGKTGTAQVGGDAPNHAWFTGFAPYDDPQIVLTVLVENGGEGSTVAVPVFREVFDWYFKED
ncbi:penicillin-binding protein 2 [Candidatus Kuenenbacteria bacterium]|nr:penicillin-binding protein 2 [Candidatus Kuenenbacteria bacterium]